MRKDELEYISDSLIIESWLQDPNMIKEAGVISEMVGGMVGSVGSAVAAEGKQLLSGKSGSDIVTTLIEFIASGALWSYSKVLWLINTIAKEAFGFDLVKFAIDIVKSIASSLTSGYVNPAEINEATKSKITANGGKVSSLLSHQMLVKEAGSLRSSLSGLSTHKAKALFGSIVGWLIKTLLTGAGLTMAVGTGSRLLGLKKDLPKTPENQSSKSEENTEQHPEEKESPSHLKPSGRGEQRFPNDDKHVWVVPVINGNLSDTLVLWALDVYPELKGMEEEIKSAPSFSRAIDMLKKEWKPNASRLAVPKGLTSRKQIVDIFAGDVVN